MAERKPPHEGIVEAIEKIAGMESFWGKFLEVMTEGNKPATAEATKALCDAGSGMNFPSEEIPGMAARLDVIARGLVPGAAQTAVEEFAEDLRSRRDEAMISADLRASRGVRGVGGLFDPDHPER